jgi:uncharacterized cupin superfamily protein
MKTMSVNDIKLIRSDLGSKFVPQFDPGDILDKDWREIEWRCFSDATGKLFGGVWEGEPGRLKVDPYPYDEICVILEGEVALTDTEGQRRSFKAGDSFFVPKSFQGVWETVTYSRKIFIGFKNENNA